MTSIECRSDIREYSSAGTSSYAQRPSSSLDIRQQCSLVPHDSLEHGWVKWGIGWWLPHVNSRISHAVPVDLHSSSYLRSSFVSQLSLSRPEKMIKVDTCENFVVGDNEFLMRSCFNKQRKKLFNKLEGSRRKKCKQKFIDGIFCVLFSFEWDFEFIDGGCERITLTFNRFVVLF